LSATRNFSGQRRIKLLENTFRRGTLLVNLKRASVIAASAALLGTLATVPAHAAGTSATAACTMNVGSITGGGDIANAEITATSPISVKRTTVRHLFAPGIAKISSTWTTTIGVAGDDETSGDVVLNTTLYGASYGHAAGGEPTSSLTAIGRGYGGYLAIEQSYYWGATVRGAQYRLRGDGVLFRTENQRTTQYSGYASVKTMALISETTTYDTLLVTTRASALYTLHIPVNTAQKPVMKVVRASTSALNGG
jgi:hypothetical protein